MTKNNLIDWIKLYGCDIIPLPEYKAGVILFKNPKTEGESWIELPVDDRNMKDLTIFRICSDLDIPPPDITLYMKPLNDHIESLHNLKRRKN